MAKDKTIFTCSECGGTSYQSLVLSGLSDYAVWH
jgi:predicted ATP-dependent serine protease